MEIKDTREKCPNCKKILIIRRGAGFSSKETKICPTSGCKYNEPPWGKSNGWGN